MFSKYNNPPRPPTPIQDIINNSMHKNPHHKYSSEDYEEFMETVVNKGETRIQLMSIRNALTKDPYIRNCWDPSTFTDEQYWFGYFDALERNLSYHYHKHGQKFETLRLLTATAINHFSKNRKLGVPCSISKGTRTGLVLPHGKYTTEGKIITYVGRNYRKTWEKACQGNENG